MDLKIACAAGAVALAMLAGCGRPKMDYSAVELVPVHGAVTLDGQPLVGAVVVFESSDGQFSCGLTGTDGTYKLQFDSVKSGVTPGTKTVRISTARRILGFNTDDEAYASSGDGEASSSGHERSSEERVPARYNEQSELTVEVTETQRRHDFHLVSS